MKKPIQNLTFIAAAAIIALASCQKENSSSQTILSTSATDNGIQSLPVDSSLVAWYPFHHGQLVDKSGYGNRIVFCSATPVASRSGLDSGAYYFDGVSSYMMVNNSPSLNPPSFITLAALIKPMGFYQGKCHGNRVLNKELNDYDKGRILLGFDDEPYLNNGCDKPVHNNREFFVGSYGNGGATASGARDTDRIRTDTWYNLVYTYDGSISRLYVNGKLKAAINSPTSFDANNLPLYIGKTQDPSFPYYLTGIIDEIRIYNRALSSDEILGLNTVMGE